LGQILKRDVLPDPGGYISFGILFLIFAAHLQISPDDGGGIFGNILMLLPPAIRGPVFDVAFEGFGQAFLIVGPLICLYAGLRHLVTQGDSLLPYITVLGGGFLSLVTGAALLSTWIGGLS